MMRCKNVKIILKWILKIDLYVFPPRVVFLAIRMKIESFEKNINLKKSENIRGALFYFDISHKQYTTSECQHTCTNKAW